MGKILGVGLATMAAATVAVPAYIAERSDYNYELEKDREAAAIAEDFLEHIPNFKSEIAATVMALEVDYNDNLKEVPADCRLTVLDQELTTITEINAAANCAYNEDQIKSARKVLEVTSDQIDYLEGYVSGTGYTTLNMDIESAKSRISDANDTSIWSELDASSGVVSVEVDANGFLEETRYEAGRELDFPDATFYTAITGLFALFGALAGNKIGNKKKKNPILANSKETELA